MVVTCLRIPMKTRCPSTLLRWMALLWTITGMACGLPQVGLPAATRIASDAGRNSDADGSPDAGGNPESACRTLYFDLSEPEGDVIIVADRSTAAGASNQVKCSGCTTYWNSLKDAVEVITGNEGDQFRCGLKLFPSIAASDSCGGSAALDVPVSSSAGQEMRALLDSTSPGGQSPATLGLRAAVNSLSSSHSAAPKMIVLALAGLPTCVAAGITQDDTSRLVTEIGQAAAAGIPVYVIGGGIPQATLDQWASTGNTEEGYTVDLPWDMLQAMQFYAMTNAPCTYALPNDRGSSPAVSLYFDDSMEMRKLTSGFSLAADGSSVTLDEKTCAELRGPSVVSLTIEINCPG